MGDIVWRWKEHYECLQSTCPLWNNEVVKQFYSGKAPRVDEICPEILKAGYWLGYNG